MDLKRYVIVVLTILTNIASYKPLESQGIPLVPGAALSDYSHEYAIALLPKSFATYILDYHKE